MQRVWKYMKKNKFLIILLVLWGVISGSMFLAYKSEWQVAMQQPRKIYEIGDLDIYPEGETVELKDNTIVCQRIEKISGNITGIGIFIDAENEEMRGTLNVLLKNLTTDDVYQEWQYDLSERKSRNYFGFILDTPIQISEKDILQFEVCADNTNSAYPLILTADVDQDNVEFNVNGEEKIGEIVPFQIYSGTYEHLKYFALSLYMGMTLIFVVIGIMVYKKKNLQTLFVTIAFLLGVIYMFIIPPFVVPDEASHFVTAYLQSSRVLNEPTVNSKGEILLPSEKLWGYTTDQRIASRDTYLQFMEGALGYDEDSEEMVASRVPLKENHPGYVPQVIGITIARLLQMNSEQILLMGRLFALIWYCFIMYWAIKLMPVKKIMLFIVGILPMTMQQIVSYNYDSVLFGVCFLVIAYILHLIYSNRKIRGYDYFIILVSGLIVATIKLVYLPILGLALFIPKQKFGGGKQKFYSGVGIVLSSAIVIVLGQLSFLKNIMGIQEGAVANSGTQMSLGYCMENPLNVMAIFYRTIERQSSRLLEGMIGSPLGWLELQLPNIIIIAFIIILLVSILQYENKTIELPKFFKGITAIFVGLICLGIMAGLFLSWTPLGSSEIDGLQGRYFIPILPVVLLLFQNNMIYIKHSNIDGYLILFSGYLQCLVAFFVTLTAIGR